MDPSCCWERQVVDDATCVADVPALGMRSRFLPKAALVGIHRFSFVLKEHVTKVDIRGVSGRDLKAHPEGRRNSNKVATILTFDDVERHCRRCSSVILMRRFLSIYRAGLLPAPV